ncbi:hypothetical protein A0J48_010555 [Sphaerospermopsis aphanizomenoides BCCUSP55]|nr:hypothetical protein [Sphaerospermopsis aphanizomenoides BCCUSP55]
MERLLLLSYPDIVVLDKNQQIALLVDIKAKKIHDEDKKSNLSKITQLYLQNSQKIRFAMLAELDNITIFQYKNGTTQNSPLKLETAEILSTYDSDFKDKKHKIFAFYLKTLVESWLRDLAYHWKSDKPPASNQLQEIELLDKIEGGDTYSHNDE